MIKINLRHSGLWLVLFSHCHQVFIFHFLLLSATFRKALYNTSTSFRSKRNPVFLKTVSQCTASAAGSEDNLWTIGAHFFRVNDFIGQCIFQNPSWCIPDECEKHCCLLSLYSVVPASASCQQPACLMDSVVLFWYQYKVPGVCAASWSSLLLSEVLPALSPSRWWYIQSAWHRQLHRQWNWQSPGKDHCDNDGR